MQIREATPQDWPAIWPFFREIVAAGDTFTYPIDLDEACARDMWLLAAPNRTVVAIDDDGAGSIVGTAKMNNNQMGNGAHVASASYMVDPRRAGQGIGRQLCRHSVDWARREGFRAMQFNAVAESNVRAVKLYESLGFGVIGTIPEGFRHPMQGYVGLRIMYKKL